MLSEQFHMIFAIIVMFRINSIFGCQDNVRVPTNKGERPILKFSVFLDKLKDITTFKVERYDGAKCLLINYEYGQLNGTPVLQNGCMLAPTSNLSNGILNVQLAAVVDGDQGMYQLTEIYQGVTSLKCYTIYILGYGCPDNERAFTEEGQKPVLNFSVVLDISKDLTTFTVTRYDRRQCMLINYEYGKPLGSPVLLNGCSMAPSADMSRGILDVQLGAFSDGDQGMYQLTEVDQDVTFLKCYTVYVLGIPTSPVISASGTLFEGTSLTLTSSSASSTSPSNHSLAMSYSWTYGASTIKADERFTFDTSLERRLTIAKLARIDNQTIIGCSAREERGKTSLLTKYTITISFGPENIRFNPSENSHGYKNGEDFSPVTCMADCQPACDFSWRKGSIPTSSTALLDLGVVDSEKLGIYTCTATHKVPGHTLIMTFNVTDTYGPSSVTLSPSTLSYTKNEGDTFAPITCSADCFPACNILWQRNSGVTAVVSNNASLLLGQIHRADRGTYICEANNPVTLKNITSRWITVNVVYGPDYVNLTVPRVKKVTEGEIIGDIDCTGDCWPGCIYTWTNLTDNQPISSSTKLTFGLVNRYDAGDYKCLAKNSAQRFSRVSENQLTLRVQYAPEVFINQSTTELFEYNRLNLLCNASGVPDVYNYTGFVQRVGDVVVPNSHAESPGVRKSISVHIPSLQLQDSGIYTCYVHNGITGLSTLIQSASQRIFVRASPKLFVKETVFTGEKSNNITIAIPFVSDPEYTTFSVSKHDGQQVSTNKKYTLQITNEFVHTVFYGKQVTLTGNVLKMTITDLSEEEFGIYNIQITNDINTTNISIHVMQTRKPSPPTELTQTSMNGIFTFEWKEGFNGGHEQTFVLQTSYNADKLWLNRTTIKESELKYRKANKIFQVNLTDLAPGIYSARLVAFNRIGTTEPVTFKDTFEVIGKQTGTTKQTSVGLVIGGAVAGIVAVLVVVIFIVFVIRQKYNCVCSFLLAKREDGYDDTLTDHRLDTHEVLNPGCNESHTYEALANKTDTVVYDAPENIGANSDILKEASAKPLPYHGNVKKGDTAL